MVFDFIFYYVTMHILYKEMKIPNYDSNLSATTGYKQGHPSMPADVFRILIYGPSNSGKTNILLPHDLQAAGV